MYLAHLSSRVLNGHAVTMQNSWTHFCGCDKRSTGTSRRPDHESAQSCPHEKLCHAGTDGPRPIRAPQGKGQGPKNHIVCGRQDNARGCASGMHATSQQQENPSGTTADSDVPTTPALASPLLSPHQWHLSLSLSHAPFGEHQPTSPSERQIIRTRGDRTWWFHLTARRPPWHPVPA
jgi:hypothetical protein